MSILLFSRAVCSAPGRRRILATTASVASADTPSAAPTTSSAPSAPKLSTGSAFGADKHAEHNDDDGDDQPAAPSVDAIQEVLTKIQDTDKPEDLEKALDKDIDTLTHNEAVVPAKVKKEFDKFRQELQQAKAKNSLDGSSAADTLKTIKGDAKTLGADLKAAA
ncbi:hypothetical protein [Nocardia aobensis]|uniref:hypothetical protein n=1 Tax=Nocardia aobensis TaxID=257277 RepID=UPI0012F6470E|nr:hypothetical protein [Nocardia aobensis]